MATSVCLLQTENGNSKLLFVCSKSKTENESLFSLLGKQQTVINDFCFSNMSIYGPYWMSMSMLHVYVHVAYQCPCCMSISMLHVHEEVYSYRCC
jgi:hypothetical protein